MRERPDAVEIIEGDGAVALTCEHASVALPEPWVWPQVDRWLVGTHWSYDPGAEELTRALAASAGWPAVLSRFSRLLVDPNRPVDDPTLFRAQAEGRVIHFNAGLSAAERERRISGFWQPYHRAADRLVGGCAAEVVCGIHTFTPVY
jgi:predicted N-formylglutamate amidohydrolase